MGDFKEYKRKQITEIRPVTQNDIELHKACDTISASFQFPVSIRDAISASFQFAFSISDADRNNGSPKMGDMIARNPKNRRDQWLIAEQYFMDNFEPF